MPRAASAVQWAAENPKGPDDRRHADRKDGRECASWNLSRKVVNEPALEREHRPFEAFERIEALGRRQKRSGAGIAKEHENSVVNAGGFFAAAPEREFAECRGERFSARRSSHCGAQGSRRCSITTMRSPIGASTNAFPHRSCSRSPLRTGMSAVRGIPAAAAQARTTGSSQATAR